MGEQAVRECVTALCNSLSLGGRNCLTEEGDV